MSQLDRNGAAFRQSPFSDAVPPQFRPCPEKIVQHFFRPILARKATPQRLADMRLTVSNFSKALSIDERTGDIHDLAAIGSRRNQNFCSLSKGWKDIFQIFINFSDK